MYLIGLRYCGGCNPQIDRARVVRSLREGLNVMDIALEFTDDRQRSSDLVLLVNGCAHACLEEAYLKEGRTTKFISVEGEMVDRCYIKEKHIPDFLIHKITELLDAASP